MNNWEIFHGELLLSEASDHSFPPLFAVAHIMVITSLGLVTLFIYLPLQEAVINPRWQTRGVVSSPKTPCLMKYICLINTSLYSAAFSPLWQWESPPGEKPKHSEIHMSHLVMSSRFTCGRVETHMCCHQWEITKQNRAEFAVYAVKVLPATAAICQQTRVSQIFENGRSLIINETLETMSSEVCWWLLLNSAVFTLSFQNVFL